MNEEDGSKCFTEGWCQWFMYKIPIDNNGNNIVTGEGSKQKHYLKSFTCVDLEVYSVTY